MNQLCMLHPGDVVAALMSFHPRVICWPKDGSEIEATKSGLRRINGIPHSVGVIDGCYIHQHRLSTQKPIEIERNSIQFCCKLSVTAI